MVAGQSDGLVAGVSRDFLLSWFGRRVYQRLSRVPQWWRTAVVTLDRPAVLGLVWGIIIGGVYITLQRAGLQRKTPPTEPRGMVGMVPGAIGRLVLLVVAWWAVFRFTDADKYWLTGALFVTYTAPLLWQVKQLVFPKK
jgi:hypothetical protein